MRQLVQIFLDRPDHIEGGMTCAACGLQRPIHKYPPFSEWKLVPGCHPDERPLRYDLPEFFPSCPACGCTEWDWPQFSQKEPRPWHPLWDAEDKVQARPKSRRSNRPDAAPS